MGVGSNLYTETDGLILKRKCCGHLLAPPTFIVLVGYIPVFEWDESGQSTEIAGFLSPRYPTTSHSSWNNILVGGLEHGFYFSIYWE